MLQKIALTLLTVGLVAQSCVSLGLDRPAPGFSFTSEKNAQHQRLTAYTDGGTTYLLPFLCNVSAWSLVPSNDSSTIEQTVLFPNFDASYTNDIRATDGKHEVMLWIGVSISRANYRLSLTAKANGTNCTLQAKYSPHKMNIDLTGDSSSEAFKTPEVWQWQELKAVISKTLDGTLPAFLTNFAQPLYDGIDKSKLCFQILAAKPGSFPEPGLSRDYILGAEACKATE